MEKAREMFSGDLSKIPLDACFISGGSVSIGGKMMPQPAARPAANPEREVNVFAKKEMGTHLGPEQKSEVGGSSDFESLPADVRNEMILWAGGNVAIAKKGFLQSEQAIRCGRVKIVGNVKTV